MTPHDFPESDWRTFRELRAVALDRFCRRVLEQIEAMIRDGSLSQHERYLKVFRFLRDRDDELEQAFNPPRRSSMIEQLAAIHKCRLLTPDELVTARTRETIEWLGKEIMRQDLP
jgi:hypothetical protein